MIPKFRAWDKETKTMNGMAEIYRNRNQEIELRPRDEKIILMQSTGLFDKNGKEIFEGDVVRMRNPRDRRQIGKFQVVRVANSPMLGLLDKKLTTEIFNLYEHMRNYYEIAGNIYENPELLEVE
nr:MAG: YopX protein [Bacteriophage sp.]